MKKTKIFAMAMATMMSVGAMGVNALASERLDEAGYAKMDNGIKITYIDENGDLIQDDLYYIPEDAEKTENKNLSRALYLNWNWDRGNYEEYVDSGTTFEPMYVFKPTSAGHLVMDSYIMGSMNYATIAVNDYTSGKYMGSTDYIHVGNGRSNCVALLSGLTDSHYYRFTMMNMSNWDSGYLSIIYANSL